MAVNNVVGGWIIPDAFSTSIGKVMDKAFKRLPSKNELVQAAVALLKSSFGKSYPLLKEAPKRPNTVAIRARTDLAKSGKLTFPKKTWIDADVSREVNGFMQKNDYSLVFKLLRYLNNLHKYATVALYADRTMVSKMSARGGYIDLVQAIYDVWLGYVDFHVQDLLKLHPAHFAPKAILKSVANLSLSKINIELLNAIDIACMTKAAAKVFRLTATNFFDRLIQISDLTMGHGTNGYKLIKAVLVLKSAKRLWEGDAKAGQRAVQLLDVVVRSVDALKVMIDLAPAGCPGKEISPWLGSAVSVAAIATIALAFQMHRTK